MIRILLAEDNRGDVLLVRQALDEYHVEHEMMVVKDGAQALEFAAALGQPNSPPCPDVVLLDLNLPKVDGLRVLAEFRKHEACAQVPVIVVSSSDSPQDVERLSGLGVTRYFRKPTDLDEFLELGRVIRDLVGH